MLPQTQFACPTPTHPFRRSSSPTQAPSPKSQADPCHHIFNPRRHHPPHPSSKRNSIHPLFSPKLYVQSAIADPRKPCPITVFMCVFLCCWFCLGVLQKILNFLKFCLWLVIFDGLGWGKRLGIWVGVMQPFCLVIETTEDILIIWLLIEIEFFWVKWY